MLITDLWYCSVNMEPTPTEPEKMEITSNDPAANNPFVSGAGIDKTPINDRQIQPSDYADAAKRVNEGHPVRNTFIVAGVVGMAAAGVAGFAAEMGPRGPETRGDIDTTIESITLSPDATLRTDPNLGDVNKATEVLHLDAQVVIDANHDIRVLTDTRNGTWYAIPLDEVQSVIPSANANQDVLWVNEQGVVDVERTDLATQ